MGLDSAPLSYFSCIWVYLSLLPVLVMWFSVSLFSTLYYSHTSDASWVRGQRNWIYTKFIHSWQFTHVLLLFLRRDTPLCMHCLCIPLFCMHTEECMNADCFSPDVCLFLLVSYTKIVVAWQKSTLRKCSLIKGHTTKIPNPIYSPN